MALASFYGNMAQSHGETTREWRKIWQQDLALKQQREAQERAAQQQDDLLQFQKDEAQADREFKEKELAEKVRQFDIRRIDDVMDMINSEADSMNRVQLNALIEEVDELYGDNETAQAGLSVLRNKIVSTPMDEPDALGFVLNFISGATVDKDGIVNIPSTSIAIPAIKSLQEFNDSGMYDSLIEDAMNLMTSYEEMEKTQLEELQLRTVANKKEAGMAPSFAEASLDDLLATTEGRREVTEGHRLSNQVLNATIDESIQIVKQELVSIQQANAEGKINLASLPDLLEAQIANIRANTTYTEAMTASEEWEYAFNVLTENAQFQAALDQAGITAAERLFLEKTMPFRIYGEEMKADEIEARIRHVNESIDMMEEEKNQTRLGILIELAANGRHDVIRELGEEFLPGFSEEQRSGILKSLEEIANTESSYIEATRKMEHKLNLSTLASERQSRMESESRVNYSDFSMELERERFEFDQETRDMEFERRDRSLDISAFEAETGRMSVGVAARNATTAEKAQALAESKFLYDMFQNSQKTVPNVSAGAVFTDISKGFGGPTWASDRGTDISSIENVSQDLEDLLPLDPSQVDVDTLRENLPVMVDRLKGLGITVPDMLMEGHLVTDDALIESFDLLKQSLERTIETQKQGLANDITIFMNLAAHENLSAAQTVELLGLPEHMWGDVIDLAVANTSTSKLLGHAAEGVVGEIIPGLMAPTVVQYPAGDMLGDQFRFDSLTEAMGIAFPDMSEELVVEALRQAGYTPETIGIEIEKMTDEARALSDTVYGMLDSLGAFELTSLDLSDPEDFETVGMALTEERATLESQIGVVASLGQQLAQVPRTDSNAQEYAFNPVTGRTEVQPTASQDNVYLAESIANVLGMDVMDAVSLGVLEGDYKSGYAMGAGAYTLFNNMRESLVDTQSAWVRLSSVYEGGFGR